MSIMRWRPAKPERLVDMGPSAGKPDSVDERWTAQEMRHREILESELLMVRPMRFRWLVH